MTAIIPNDEHCEQVITLDEFMYRCDAGLDYKNEDSIASLGGSLAALARNKNLFANFLHDQLLNAVHSGSTHPSGRPKHSEQTFVIARRPKYYVRMAVWDAPRDRGDSRSRDNEFFSYGLAHNHAFSLLTTGLMGSGYLSENYTLDIQPRILMLGQKVMLKREKDLNLSEGTVLMYRKWHDVHCQRPSSGFSISLNLLVGDSAIPQYSFATDSSTVSRHLAGLNFELSSIISIAKSYSLNSAIDLFSGIKPTALLCNEVFAKQIEFAQNELQAAI